MSYCKCGGSYSRGGKVENCVCETARKIARMQCKAEKVEEHCMGCEVGELGGYSKPKRQYNTRPVILYLPNGKPFKVVTCPDTCKPTSCIFRIEKVERCGCCATVRALMLKEVPSRHCECGGKCGGKCGECEYKLVPTHICATVDLEKFVGIQCLHDTYIPCL